MKAVERKPLGMLLEEARLQSPTWQGPAICMRYILQSDVCISGVPICSYQLQEVKISFKIILREGVKVYIFEIF